MATRRERVFYEMTATDNASRVFRQVEGSAQRLGGAYQQVFAAVTLLASGGFASSLVRAAKEAEQSQNRLTATLKATGHQVGLTRRELDEMADAMAEATQFDDEALRNAQGHLVKFGNVQGQVFRDALKISADLASFMGQDLPSAASNVGRALSAPVQGLENLQTYIGRVTQAEMDHLKALTAQGRAVEAQNEVLRILQERIGGTADAMNTGLTKATNDFGKAWDDLMETIGSSSNVFTDTIGGAAALLKDVERELRGVRTPLRDLAQDSLEWLTVLRFVPGTIGLIGHAARNAQLELDKQRRTVSGRIRNPGLETAAALEASLAATPAVPIQLYGTIDVSAAKAAATEAAKAAKLAAERQAQQDEQFAFRFQMRAEREALFGGEKEALEFLKKEGEERRNLAEAAQEQQDAQAAMHAVHAQAREDEFNSVARLEQQFDRLRESQEDAKKAGQELGFTFVSAFEDAILEARKLGEVLNALLNDIARIVLRKAFTEPAAKALGDWAAGAFGGLFGGAKAAGGPVVGGRAYLVGEQGPERFVPWTDGTIVPNGAGGVVFAPQIHIDSRADRAQVLADVDRAMRMSEARILDSFQRGGRFARAAGTA